MAELDERVLPAVFSVFTREERLTDNGREEQQEVGSGVLVSPECHILTAAHVVDIFVKQCEKNPVGEGTASRLDEQ